MLQNELRKIEARKKERDKKTQDLQKLITAADHQNEPRKVNTKFQRKKFPATAARPRVENLVGSRIVSMLGALQLVVRFEGHHA